MAVTASRPVSLLPGRSTRYSQTGCSGGHQSWFGEEKNPLYPPGIELSNRQLSSLIELSFSARLFLFVFLLLTAVQTQPSWDGAAVSGLSVAEEHFITRTQHQSQDVERTVVGCCHVYMLPTAGQQTSHDLYRMSETCVGGHWLPSVVCFQWNRLWYWKRPVDSVNELMPACNMEQPAGHLYSRSNVWLSQDDLL